jgi:hypothetical protein
MSAADHKKPKPFLFPFNKSSWRSIHIEARCADVERAGTCGAVSSEITRKLPTRSSAPANA